MKRKIFAACAIGLCPATVAWAQLTIHVDTSVKEYYLDGSATGAVGGDEETGYQVFWNNGQPFNGGFPTFLSQAAFIVTGNTASNFTMFIHGNGNINGVLEFTSGSPVTLTGNAAVRYDYSGWAPGVIMELESKAAFGEMVAVINGSPNFALGFATAAVPEPSTYAVIVGIGALLGAALFRRRRTRTQEASQAVAVQGGRHSSRAEAENG